MNGSTILTEYKSLSSEEPVSQAPSQSEVEILPRTTVHWSISRNSLARGYQLPKSCVTEYGKKRKSDKWLHFNSDPLPRKQESQKLFLPSPPLIISKRARKETRRSGC